MFRKLRVRTPQKKASPDLDGIPVSQLIGDASIPVSIKALNSLPENPKLRLYRTLIPVRILADFDINLRTWKNPDKQIQVKLDAQKGTNVVKLSAWYGDDPNNEFFYLEIADNSYQGIDLHFLFLNNPTKKKFHTDFDDKGRSTLFGTVHRNFDEEEKAMMAGLSPGQIREGLRASKIVFSQLESFLTMIAHHAIFLEPMTYVSAWVFEKYGFAYMRGHKLLDTIEREFQPGGELNKALDGSTPFRKPDQWKTVRGRAWAIHDGILETIGKRWDDLRMIKQVGRDAGANTFPGGKY